MIRIDAAIVGIALSLSGTNQVFAQGAGTPSRTFQASSHFVDGTTGSWTQKEEPILTQAPSEADLIQASPAIASADFGVSFNCAVRRSGAVDDCRPIYGTPDTLKASLTHALARHVRLSRASAALARRSAYRVTIDVAATTYDQPFVPRQCVPPFCIVEGAVAPPPPPQATDPVVAGAIERARRCFDAAWEPSVEARFKAEKMLREGPDAGASPAYRKLAHDYVDSRHVLASCIMALQEARRSLPLSDDNKALVAQLEGMRANYAGQTKYELSVLMGLLDRATVAKEETFSF